jgi:hypothetical protein
MGGGGGRIGGCRATQQLLSPPAAPALPAVLPPIPSRVPPSALVVTARRYEKPCDVTKKKVKLLTVKPLFLHLNLSGASPFFPRFVRLPQRALPPHCFLLLLPFTRPRSPKFRPVTPQQQVNVKSPSFVRANTAVVPRLLFPYASTAALKPNDTRRR